MKRILSLFLAISMVIIIFNGVSVNAISALTDSQITSIVDEYIGIVGSNRYWNANIRNNQELLKTQVNNKNYLAATTSPCKANPSHSSNYGSQGCTSNVFTGVSRGSAQCWGFGDYIEYVIFKTTNGSDWTKHYSVDSNFKFRPGDLIWTQKNSSYQHIMVVYKTNSDGSVKIIEGNYGGKCHINTRTLSDPHSYVNYSSASYVLTPPSTLRTNSHTHSYTISGYESAHPHKYYSQCSCGAKTYSGKCTFDTNYEYRYDSAHPHNRYKYCTICATKDYSCGGSQYVDSCRTCKPYIATGTCGNNLTWKLDHDGVLTISGNGDMNNYEAGTAPWYNYIYMIKSVVIENGVTSIGNNAFKYCDIISDIEIPNSITSIGEFAFHNCTRLTSIEIPNNVTSIGNYAFSWCKSLSEIKIPNSITSIGNYAFEGCSSLTKFTIPNSVTSIGNYTFQLCDSLSEITIPNSVNNIEVGAFFECTTLTDVYYSGSESQWNEILINSGNDCLLNATIHFNSSMPDEPSEELPEEPTVTVSGSVKSFGDTAKDMVFEILNNGEVVDTKTVTGNSGTYTFEEVEEGTYTVRVSKTKHAVREYNITVTDSNVTQDVEIRLYGDVNADGIVNAGDTLQINRKVANLPSVFNQTTDADYRLKVANITNVTMNDNIINAADTLQINRKVANLSSIFDRIA